MYPVWLRAGLMCAVNDASHQHTILKSVQWIVISLSLWFSKYLITLLRLTRSFRVALLVRDDRYVIGIIVSTLVKRATNITFIISHRNLSCPSLSSLRPPSPISELNKSCCDDVLFCALPVILTSSSISPDISLKSSIKLSMSPL